MPARPEALKTTLIQYCEGIPSLRQGEPLFAGASLEGQMADLEGWQGLFAWVAAAVGAAAAAAAAAALAVVVGFGV